MQQLMTNNNVSVSGVIGSELNYSHTLYGEKFYEFSLFVSRLSGISDIIPVTISDRLIGDIEMCEGRTITIKGQYRSYNKYDGEKSKLMLSVFAREIFPDIIEINPNEIVIDGFICKAPIYRTTPFKREICDVLIAVNRAFNKSDYIPCIAWGRNARFVGSLEVGSRLKLSGRIQSREYVKQVGEEQIKRIAYEVSINKIVENDGYDIIEELEINNETTFQNYANNS